MAAWLDIVSLIIATFAFVGTILGGIWLVHAISAYVSRTKESLKQRGWTVSEKGVSVKTSKRMNREDYLDATQRGFIKAMGASHHSVDPSISAGSPPAVVRRDSSSSVHTAGSESGSSGEKTHRRLFSRKAKQG